MQYRSTKHCRLETRYYTTKLERPSEQEIRDERSRPFGQYDAQWLRECDRIRYQLISRSGGRKETLPFDPELSEVEVVKNAHENVENRWIKQGIWDENWLKDEPEWLRYLVPPPPMKTWRHERYGMTPTETSYDDRFEVRN